jgi:NAD(P)-dependent dehydrogenase (short-subunit alcohol dehydrogenase family)
MGTPIINKSGGEFKISQVPLQRAGTEEDMAGLILYLTSRAGGYVTGTVLLTDGGRLSVNPAVY